MNTETFIQKRDELISKIKELDLYKEYKKLDSLIYEDKIIQELNTKKKNFFKIINLLQKICKIKYCKKFFQFKKK